MNSAVERAKALANSGRVSEAVAQLEACGKGGDGDCFFELALWHFQGQPVARDLRRSRDYFRLAADAGHYDAARIYVALLANGTAGDRNWRAALELLAAAADAGDPEALRELALLEAMAIDEDGNPVAVPPARALSDKPEVKLFQALLTADECQYLLDQAAPRFQRAVVIDSLTGKAIPHPVRTSDNAGFPWISETPVVHAINRRIAKASQTEAGWGEPLQVLRYRPGQEYKPHHDGLADEPNQRIFTMLVYLNNGFEGGETMFVRTGLKVVGDRGDALLFRNSDHQGNPDPIAEHAGLPVTMGEKIIASRWIRQARFGPL